MAFYSAYLFDRSLDEQEIKEFIRKYIDPEYLLPSEIPTPDCYYDFSLGSNDDENRETIKDQSGNGSDAKAYNIAWSGMSGYGGYSMDIVNLKHDPFQGGSSGTVIQNNTENTIHITYTSSRQNGTPYDWFAFWGRHIEKVEGTTVDIQMTDDSLALYYRYYDGTSVKQIKLTNGINYLPGSVIDPNDRGNRDGIYSTNSIEGVTVVIKEIPQYPGALVLDGVDDYIVLKAFTSGFKTIFMLCSPNIANTVLYDQRKSSNGMKFAIANVEVDKIAYEQRNDGKTFINGKLNTSVITNNLINKKHLITIINNSIDKSQKPFIGASVNVNLFAKMVLYKFLGFKDELTEEQIQAIIKKYNLLDGVDEIEVS